MASVALAFVVAGVSRAVEAGNPSKSRVAVQPLQDHCEDCLHGQTSLLQVNTDLRSGVLSVTNVAKKDEAQQVPSTMQCVLVVIVQYLAFLGLSHMTKGVCWSKSRLLRAFSGTDSLAALLPVAGVLFVTHYVVAAEMSGEDSNPAVYGLPQWWACIAMVLATIAGVASMSLQFCSLACHAPEPFEEQPTQNGRTMVFGCFQGCRWLATAFQFIGLSTAVAAALFMQQPFDVWLDNGRVWLSFVSTCTLGVLVQLLFFHGIGLLGADEIVNGGYPAGAPIKITAVAAKAQALGPTVCVLFSAAHFRLFDMKRQGNTIQWPEAFVYACVYGLLARTFLACTMAAWSNRTADAPHEDHQGWRCVPLVLRTSELLAFLAVLVGIVGVVTSFFYARRSDGWHVITPPMSCSLACVLTMVVQHTVAQIVAFFSRSPSATDQALIETGSVCPMLGVLFLATLIRACQVSPGALPQVWVQTCTRACALASLLNMFFAALSTRLAKNEDHEEGRGRACLRLGVGCCRAGFATLLGTSALSIVCGIGSMSVQNVPFKLAY